LRREEPFLTSMTEQRVSLLKSMLERLKGMRNGLRVPLGVACETPYIRIATWIQ
jgi:hypothetical protein